MNANQEENPGEERRRRCPRREAVQQRQFRSVARALEGRDHDPPVVVADFYAEDGFALGGLLEDERVALLRIAEAMVEDPVEVVLVAGRHRAGHRKPRAVEPAAVFHPADRHELRPLQVVGEIDTGFDVADEDLLPIATARREPVRDGRSRAVDFHRRQRDRSAGKRAVGRAQTIRIDEHAGDAVHAVVHVEHRLIGGRCCAGRNTGRRV